MSGFLRFVKHLFINLLVFVACTTITIRKTVFPGMSIVQFPFLIAILESMAGITSGTTGIIVKRRVASRTCGV